jgi:hypothetical protein
MGLFVFLLPHPIEPQRVMDIETMVGIELDDLFYQRRASFPVSQQGQQVANPVENEKGILIQDQRLFCLCQRRGDFIAEHANQGQYASGPLIVRIQVNPLFGKRDGLFQGGFEAWEL